MMTEPTDSPSRSREFQLKWEMGARGAAAIAARLPNFDAQIELGREGLWLNGKSILDFMLATRIEGAPLITVRTSGPDAEKALDEFERLFDCEPQPPCACGKPRLIGWDSAGAEFVCANSHSWFVSRPARPTIKSR